MHFRVVSLVTLLCFLFSSLLMKTTLPYSANLPNPYQFIDNVAINCGSIGNSTALDGREWIGDTGSKYTNFMQLKGKSRSSTAIHKSFYADSVPSMTARISSAQFHYMFQVNPGQIFVRLHFHPSIYRGFEKLYDFFSVEAGPFTLLSNFSASLARDGLGVKNFVKEYLLTVEENQLLTIVFSPSKPEKTEKTYAFVNGIEIISMPTGLYYTPVGDLGAHIVGQKNRFHVDDKSALETVQRLNIGGYSISPTEDSSLYRRWSGDADYLMETEVHSVDYGRHMIKIPPLPVFFGPLEVYQTSWSSNADKLNNKIYNLTWKIPVDVGFGYLIRLHFCELEPGIIKSGQREFSVLINNQLAENKADIMEWSGGYGIPVHRDYMMIIKGDREGGKGILVIVVQSKIEFIDGLLNGLEIMKLSDHENNLASPTPEFSIQGFQFWSLHVLKLKFVFVGRNGIATILTIVVSLINIIVYNLRKFWEENLLEITSRKREENSDEDKYKLPASKEPPLCRHFSFAEIKLATQNFNDGSVIGKGGFGKVYKGFIDDGATIVAIKRLNTDSKQGAPEFWMEIETLSKLRHRHLVSLIGYCHESDEMILVYEYMPGGTLADLLYGIHRSRDLTWEQRLRICIGAARGLDYLHTGAAPGIIHRDVKDSNILLDENFVAKVSDFGIAKLETSSQLNSYITTNVKGTFGYLDPHYYLTCELSKKSDVYAFGVVMMVVLCGRPAVDRRLSEDQHGLVMWVQERIKEGVVDQIIDGALKDQISSSSLKAFVEIANTCFHRKPRERPTMAQVVVSLEFALKQEQQRNAPLMSQDVESVGDFSSLASTQSLHTVSEEMTDVGGPCADETFIQYELAPETQENAVSTSKGKMQKKEPDNEANLRRRNKDDTSNYKQASRWPWNMPWTRAKPKPSKNEDLIFPASSSNAGISHFSGAASEDVNLVGQILPVPNLKEFSFADLKTATRNFKSDAVVTMGGFGTVFRGRVDETTLAPSKFGTMLVSVKKFNPENEGFQEWQAEVYFLGRLSHPNLLKLLGYCCEDKQLFLVHEFMPNGSLADHLFGSSIVVESLAWDIRLKIAIGAAKGLDFLHTSEELVIHRDFKPSHILLDQNYNAKISDFGYAKLGPSFGKTHVTTRIIGTYGYADPEYIATGHLSVKSDVYNFGVVLLEILTGFQAVDRNRSEGQQNLLEWTIPQLNVKRRLKSIMDPRMEGQYSSKAALQAGHLTIRCLNSTQRHRPTMKEVVEVLEHIQTMNKEPT